MHRQLPITFSETTTNYTNGEMADMHFMYGLAVMNTRASDLIKNSCPAIGSQGGICSAGFFKASETVE
jgi:hypothetical protein